MAPQFYIDPATGNVIRAEDGAIVAGPPGQEMRRGTDYQRSRREVAPSSLFVTNDGRIAETQISEEEAGWDKTLSDIRDNIYGQEKPKPEADKPEVAMEGDYPTEIAMAGDYPASASAAAAQPPVQADAPVYPPGREAARARMAADYTMDTAGYSPPAYGVQAAPAPMPDAVSGAAGYAGPAPMLGLPQPQVDGPVTSPYQYQGPPSVPVPVPVQPSVPSQTFPASFPYQNQPQPPAAPAPMLGLPQPPPAAIPPTAPAPNVGPVPAPVAPPGVAQAAGPGAPQAPVPAPAAAEANRPRTPQEIAALQAAGQWPIDDLQLALEYELGSGIGAANATAQAEGDIADALAKKGQIEASIRGGYQADESGLIDPYQTSEQDLKDEILSIRKAERDAAVTGGDARYKEHQRVLQQQEAAVWELSKSTIDPGSFWRNAGTGRQIAMGLGALAQGFLTLRGFGQGNPVLDSIERAIGRDIAAQESTLGAKKEALTARSYLLRSMLEVSGDKREAEKLATAAALNYVAAQADAMQDRITSATGKENMQILAAQARIKAAQEQEAVASKRRGVLMEVQKHNLNMLKIRADIAESEARARKAGRTGSGKGSGKETERAVRPEANVVLDFAKTYDPKVDFDRIVTSPYLSNKPEGSYIGVHVTGTPDEKKALTEILASMIPVTQELDLLRSFYMDLKNKDRIPGDQLRERMVAIGASLISGMRVRGEGAQTIADEERNQKRIAEKALKLGNFVSSEDADAILGDTMNGVVRRVEARISGTADPFQMKSRFVYDNPFVGARKGQGKLQKPSEALSGIGDLPTGKEVTGRVMPGTTGTGKERAARKTSIKYNELVTKTPEKTSIANAKALAKSAEDSAEYIEADAYLNKAKGYLGQLRNQKNEIEDLGDKVPREWTEAYNHVARGVRNMEAARSARSVPGMTKTIEQLKSIATTTERTAREAQKSARKESR